jgi:hypothetical protein
MVLEHGCDWLILTAACIEFNSCKNGVGSMAVIG